MKHSRVRNGFSEPFIVVAVVLGFFWMASQGKMSLQDLGSYIGFLVIIVLFYFALLFCRMMFFWMTGGENTPWWMHVEQAHKMHLDEMQKRKEDWKGSRKK